MENFVRRFDIVVNDHNHKRSAPQTPEGIADLAHGIRQFVVGTGETKLRQTNTVQPNSEVRGSST